MTGSNDSHHPPGPRRGLTGVRRPGSILLALLTAFSVPGLAAQEVDVCHEAAVQTSVTWISSAVGYEGGLVSGGIGAVAVEPTSNRVMLYDSYGEAVDLGHFDQAGTFLPSTIRQTPGGKYVLKLAGNDFLVLSESLQLERPLGPTLNDSDTRGLSSVYDWAATNNWLFGFGSVRDVTVPERYRLGFLTAPLDSLDNPKLALEVDEGEFYLYNQPYFAAVGDRGYFVRFSGGEATLYSIDRDGAMSEIKGAIPKAYRHAPVVNTPNRGPESAPAIYAEIEDQGFVAGLFSVDERLFLLTRRPYMRHKTLWKVYPVDVRGNSRPQPQLVLPTFAPHITFVLTSKQAMIFEKGRVYGGGKQRIDLLKTFNADWLLKPEESPLLLQRMEKSLVRCVGL